LDVIGILLDSGRSNRVTRELFYDRDALFDPSQIGGDEMKTIRKAVFRSKLEAQLSKYERRIQKMAENAYKIRQFLETLNREVQNDAIHPIEPEGSVSGGSLDNGTGGADISDSAAIETVLEEQPAELPDNSGDLGVNSGCAV
jgi:hypothetical protein